MDLQKIWNDIQRTTSIQELEKIKKKLIEEQRPKMIDTYDTAVSIKIAANGKTVWVNVDGRCVFRAFRAPYIQINDKRERLLSPL